MILYFTIMSVIALVAFIVTLLYWVATEGVISGFFSGIVTGIAAALVMSVVAMVPVAVVTFFILGLKLMEKAAG